VQARAASRGEVIDRCNLTIPFSEPGFTEGAGPSFLARHQGCGCFRLPALAIHGTTSDKQRGDVAFFVAQASKACKCFNRLWVYGQARSGNWNWKKPCGLQPAGGPLPCRPASQGLHLQADLTKTPIWREETFRHSSYNFQFCHPPPPLPKIQAIGAAVGK